MADKNKKPSALEELTENLYSKNQNVKDYERKRFLRKKKAIAEDWAIEGSDEVENRKEGKGPTKPPKKMTTFTKFFIGSLAFLFISIATAAVIFVTGQNSLRYDNVAIAVLGPNSVAGGEVLSFDVIVTNQNAVDLELTDVIIDYPEASFAADGSGAGIGRVIEPIDTFPSGSRETKRFDVVMFGQEGERKDIRISFEYRVPGSNNLFYKERVYEVQMESSPVEVRSEHLERSTSGSQIEIMVEAVSNSNQVVNGLFLEVEYPFGFVLATSTPAAISGDGFFEIGSLAPGEIKRIFITGAISGQDDELRNFSYNLGLGRPDGNGLSQIFASSESDILIERPPITLTSTADNRSDQIVVRPAGDTVDFVLSYLNNLASEIVDPVITATLSGNYDPRSIIVNEGFYNSNSAQIRWTQNDTPVLRQVTAAERGSVDFSLRLLNTSQLAGSVINPEVDVRFSIEGGSFDQTGATREVASSITKRVKIATEAELQSGVFHSVGPFDNEGPFQPTVGQDSSYAVLWRLRNTVNDIENLQVQATLPTYVQYMGYYDPENNLDVDYDPRSRTLTWNVERLQAGAGYDKDPTELFIQVGITPSLSQEGSYPDLINRKQISGTDSFTRNPIEFDAAPETTADLDRDPQFQGGRGAVRD